MTIRQRRKKLEEMRQGNGLGDAYTATLTRLKAQKGNKPILGLKVLMWVLYSERPLLAKELCHALGVELGSVDLDLENVPTLRTILASSLGLVTVEVSSSTVRLVHFTLQEHLLSDPTVFHSPHSTIAEVCLTYLNFGRVRNLSPLLDSAPTTMPFLKYASCYWGEHTRRNLTENVKILALRLLDGFEKHISAQLMLRNYSEGELGSSLSLERGLRGFTGLHGAAFLGIVGLVAAVLEMKEWDVNAIDSIEIPTLVFPAEVGIGDVYRRSLGSWRISSYWKDITFGRTPLLWAVERGHEGVVEVLLNREDVNPNQEGTGLTLLLLAVERGHEGIVKLLLEQECINPNQADTRYGQTPLLWAAACGHEGVTNMLLDRVGVNPNQVDIKYGQTPLLWAAQHGHEGVVKMLLDREGVSPNQTDSKYGRTPLSWAAEYGHEGVVKMLLDREGVNPDRTDRKYGRTPLSWAAQKGRERVVKMLLDRKGVNPDHEDIEYGRTPLLWAAVNGHEGVVKMLSDREGVNPDRTDRKYGRMPPSWAAVREHERVVKMLLERKDILTDIRDNNKGKPLSLALSQKHDRIAKMLSEHHTNSYTAGRHGHAFSPSFAIYEGESVAGTQFRSENS